MAGSRSRKQLPGPIYFTLDGRYNRTGSAWRRAGPGASIEANARKFAAREGVAGVWHASGAFTLFYQDAGKVRRKSWRLAVPRAGRRL